MKQYIILLLWSKMNTFLSEMRGEEREGYLFSLACEKLIVVLSGNRIIGSVKREVWNG